MFPSNKDPVKTRGDGRVGVNSKRETTPTWSVGLTRRKVVKSWRDTSKIGIGFVV